MGEVRVAETWGPFNSVKFNQFYHESDYMQGSVLGTVGTTVGKTVLWRNFIF